MHSIVQITELHINTYRAIRDYIYHNRKTPDILTIGDICGFHNDQEILSILKDLKELGYLIFDGPQKDRINLAN